MWSGINDKQWASIRNAEHVWEKKKWVVKKLEHILRNRVIKVKKDYYIKSRYSFSNGKWTQCTQGRAEEKISFRSRTKTNH